MSNGTHGERDPGRAYLYCLIKDPKEVPFPLATSGIGDPSAEVYPIHFLDLAFLASNCAELHYPENRTNILHHHKVIEEVMRRGFNSLPVRFSTVATPSRTSTAREQIERVLRRRFGEFQGLLRDMEDKVELGLKAYWRKERLFEDVLQESREIRLLRDRIASRPASGLAWRAERLQLGTMVNRAMEAKRNTQAADLTKSLHPLAHDYKTSKITSDMMVLNAAFLVPRQRTSEFDAKVNELDQRFGQQMRFSYVGPVPPFNFVELIIHWEKEEEEAQQGWEEVKGTWYKGQLPQKISGEAS